MQTDLLSESTSTTNVSTFHQYQNFVRVRKLATIKEMTVVGYKINAKLFETYSKVCIEENFVQF